MLAPHCRASLSRESPCPPRPIMAMLSLGAACARKRDGPGQAAAPAASAETLRKRRRERDRFKEEEVERIVFYVFAGKVGRALRCPPRRGRAGGAPPPARRTECAPYHARLWHYHGEDFHFVVGAASWAQAALKNLRDWAISGLEF